MLVPLVLHGGSLHWSLFSRINFLPVGADRTARNIPLANRKLRIDKLFLSFPISVLLILPIAFTLLHKSTLFHTRRAVNLRYTIPKKLPKSCRRISIICIIYNIEIVYYSFDKKITWKGKTAAIPEHTLDTLAI
jgi:hypothetical protein